MPAAAAVQGRTSVAGGMDADSDRREKKITHDPGNDPTDSDSQPD